MASHLPKFSYLLWAGRSTSIVKETLAHFIFQLLRFIVTFLSLSIHFLKAHWVPATQLGHQLCWVQGFGDSGEFIFSFLLLWWILLSFYKLSRRIIRGYCYVTLQHSDYHQARQQRKILNKIFSFILSFQAQNLQKLGQEFETLCVIFCSNLHIEINIRNYDE